MRVGDIQINNWNENQLRLKNKLTKIIWKVAENGRAN